MWDGEEWVPYEPPLLAHITCCDITVSLCLEDMEGEPEATDEGVEICLKCLRLESDGAPCVSRMCPHRPRLERAQFLWRRGRQLRALAQLLPWRH